MFFSHSNKPGIPSRKAVKPYVNCANTKSEMKIGPKIRCFSDSRIRTESYRSIYLQPCKISFFTMFVEVWVCKFRKSLWYRASGFAVLGFSVFWGLELLNGIQDLYRPTLNRFRIDFLHPQGTLTLNPKI